MKKKILASAGAGIIAASGIVTGLALTAGPTVVQACCYWIKGMHH